MRDAPMIMEIGERREIARDDIDIRESGSKRADNDTTPDRQRIGACASWRGRTSEQRAGKRVGQCVQERLRANV
jgi:hypothetical protein